MGDNQFPVVEDIVTDKTIEKLGDFDAELIWLLAELFHRLCKTVGALHVPASQSSHELHVVITGNAESLPTLHHIGDEAKNLHGSRSAIHQVAHEDQLAATIG